MEVIDLTGEDDCANEAVCPVCMEAAGGGALACGHALCAQCQSQLWQSKDPVYVRVGAASRPQLAVPVVACPLCRRQVPVAEAEVNFVLLGHERIMAVQLGALMGPVERVPDRRGQPPALAAEFGTWPSRALFEWWARDVLQRERESQARMVSEQAFDALLLYLTQLGPSPAGVVF